MTSLGALAREQLWKKIDVSVSIPYILHHTALATSVVMLRAPCVTRIFRPPDPECADGLRH